MEVPHEPPQAAVLGEGRRFSRTRRSASTSGSLDGRQHKNGISSYEMARDLGVTQKTAWFMNHRIRLAMQSGGMGPMGGEVEVDETFIGGRARFMHAAKKRERGIRGTGSMSGGKAAVMGLLERHGPDGHSRVRTKLVPNTKRKVLDPVVREHVTKGRRGLHRRSRVVRCARRRVHAQGG
ncbi:MAG: IS1595 family transposase [bacterium]